MDDPLKELEDELGRLRPVAPGRELFERIDRRLEPRGRGWLWALIPAACALAAAAGLHWGAHAPTGARAAPASGMLSPVVFQDVLVGSSDEGYVELADGWPARRVLEAHVDTIVWRDPSSASSLRWSVPREEVRIVPVSFQ